jgi:hypothetical protein
MEWPGGARSGVQFYRTHLPDFPCNGSQQTICPKSYGNRVSSPPCCSGTCYHLDRTAPDPSGCSTRHLPSPIADVPQRPPPAALRPRRPYGGAFPNPESGPSRCANRGCGMQGIPYPWREGGQDGSPCSTQPVDRSPATGCHRFCAAHCAPDTHFSTLRRHRRMPKQSKSRRAIASHW